MSEVMILQTFLLVSWLMLLGSTLQYVGFTVVHIGLLIAVQQTQAENAFSEQQLVGVLVLREQGEQAEVQNALG